MKELGTSSPNKQTLNTKSLKKPINPFIKRLLVGILFLSSIAFYFGAVQPTILSDINVKNSKLISSRLLDFQNGTNLTASVADRFNIFMVEYGRQDCDIDVKFDVNKNTGDYKSIVSSLSYNSEDKTLQTYGPFYSAEQAKIIDDTNLELLNTSNKILDISKQYNELDGFISYLNVLRSTCGSITSVEPNRTKVVSESCTTLTNAFANFKQPSSPWLLNAWTTSQNYVASCKTQKDFTSILNGFVIYFAKVSDIAPDMTKVRSDIEDLYNEATKTVANSKNQLIALKNQKTNSSGVLYLLNLKV